jgi:hypothetical protein
MKLRIRDNSLRFRLTRGEVEALDALGTVSARIAFAGDSTLTYAIESSPACVAPTALFDGEQVVVRVPASAVETWAATDQVSIRDEQRLSSGDTLVILVEKDFACPRPREGEDESDMFANPGVSVSET